MTLARRLCNFGPDELLWKRPFVYEGLDIDELKSIVSMMRPENMHIVWHGQHADCEMVERWF